MSKSLLEQAKQIKVGKHTHNTYTKEDLELVEAWLVDEITITQIARVKEYAGIGNIYAFLARGAREIFRTLNLKETDNEQI